MTDVLREVVLPRLDGVRKSGSGFMARCPAHDDATASLSVGPGRDQPVVLNCQAGCPPDDILGKLGLAWEDLSNPREAKTGPAVVAQYEYRDETGQLLYVKERHHPKKFVCKRPDGAGGWVYRGAMTGVRRVLYRLPELLAAVHDGQPVYVVEGEKDVETLRRLGKTATTNWNGAGKWLDEYAEAFTGAEVRVIADRDDPGRAHAATVAASLRGVAASVSVAQPPESYPEHADITDVLDAGGKLTDLELLDDEQPPTQQPPTQQQEPDDGRIDWAALDRADYTATQFITEPLLQPGGLVALTADGKAGKSLFCFEWSLRLAAGLPFLDNPARDPLRVLYIDQENPHPEIQRRTRTLGFDGTDRSNLVYLSFPRIGPLDTPAGAAALAAYVERYAPDVVFLDTISRMIAGKENDSDTWLALYRLALAPIKQLGIAVVRLDHFGQNPRRGARGSSAKTQDVDHAWELTDLNQGGLLRLHRTHTRNGIGAANLTLRRTGDPVTAAGTTHEVVTDTPVDDIIAQLDAADVPADYGRDKLRVECARLGIKAGTPTLQDVAKRRKAERSAGMTLFDDEDQDR